MSMDQHDDRMHPRCPPLGGPVPFSHCRRVNDGLPCHRVVVCWADRIEIGSFLREEYTPDEIERMSRQPESRLDVMLGTLARVRSETSETG